MPPKKKKGKGKGKKKASAKASARKSATRKEKPSGEETLSELGREFYLIQIRDLETRVTRYQRKCDELELKNETLQTDADRLEGEKRDMHRFFSQQLEDRNDSVSDLHEKFMALQEERVAERDQYEVKIQTLRASNQAEKDQLSSEVTILQGKLNSVEEFVHQKDELETRLAELEREIESKEKRHQEILNDLERKAVQDKNRLKKEMEARLNDVAAEFRRVSNQQMADTTKRTIIENVAVSSQLSKMSDKMDELIRENDELKKKVKVQAREMQLLDYNQKEFAKKHVNSQKIVQMITSKFKDQDQLLNEYIERDRNRLELEGSLATAMEAAEMSEMEREKLHHQLDEKEEEIKQSQTKLAAVSEQNSKLSAILSECASAIQGVLKVPSESTGDTPSPPRDPLARESFLSSLFSLLNSAASVRLAPGPAAAFNPKAGRRSPLRPLSGGGSFEGYHYLPGDLGLVPRPTVASMQSPSTLGQLRRVKTRSIGTQCGPNRSRTIPEQTASSKGELIGGLVPPGAAVPASLVAATNRR
ncbi:cilia- and flagella-associated protein 157-like [Oscarella lobularis]|uniref:cilia- and flagella-associated protein 157-like n=1 Tax=Oscarella lobularis TaxID=121494 RepID=UPI003313C5DC